MKTKKHLYYNREEIYNFLNKKDIKRSVGIISMLIYNFIKYFNHAPGLSDNHDHVYYS